MTSQVLIVGAGPAGAMAAIRLAQQGVKDVLLIDRAQFPHTKPCASGLGPNALKVLDEVGLGARARQQGYPMQSLRLFTPGLFGYRMIQYITVPDKSSSYWGLVGQDPRIVEMKSPDPQVRAAVLGRLKLWPEEAQGMQSSDPRTREAAAEGIRARLGFFVRHSGTGEYAGVLVALLAVFALANSWRGPNTPFSAGERRAVWFWGAAALISILVAWGRHGFLYSLLYRVPYFSAIRNPIKFLHPFHVAWLILAGYGLEVLHRRYLQNVVKQNAAKQTDLLPEHLRRWWAKAAGFEKRWAAASALAVAASLAGVMVLISCKDRLVMYLVDDRFKVELAPQMAGFCVSEAIWFSVFLFLSAVVLAGILSGAWSGPRARWAWIYLGAIMVMDLGRSDRPWIHYYDYEQKYSTNDVVDFLTRNKPYEQRVMGRLSPRGPGSSNGRGFGQMYDFWMQNDFPCHDIQTLDFAQMSRWPVMDDAYLRNFELKGTNVFTTDLRPAARLWELTGTRYLLLDANGVQLLNEHADPVRRGFRLVFALRMHPKADVQFPEDPGDLTADQDPKGAAALIEFTRVLPRAKLYANWQTPSNGEATLATLLSPEFDPAQTVLLWTNTPAAQPPGDAKTGAGSVEITDYRPRHIKLHANAKTPAVLLFNDRFAPEWKASVDQKPCTLLRCNYIMRGVFLEPGEHTVEFRFRPPLTTLCLSLGGWAAGLLLAGYLLVSRRSGKPPSV